MVQGTISSDERRELERAAGRDPGGRYRHGGSHLGPLPSCWLRSHSPGLIGVIATDSRKAYTLMFTGLAIIAAIGALMIYKRHFS